MPASRNTRVTAAAKATIQGWVYRVWASVSGGASKQVFFSSNPKVSSGMSKMGRTAGQQA